MSYGLYPLKFAPVYKDYLWGGDRISRKYGRKLPAGTYAESWEISDRPEGMSVVTSGSLAGQTLGALVKEFGDRLVGKGASGDRFPLLVKIIDAHARLSVQVHPSDENASSVGGEPKTEMWYVLGARAGAKVFVGFRSGVDRAAFEKAVQQKAAGKTLEPVLVKPADAILVPGGVVHCIDAGLLLLEIQQNSNTTYRVYDWDRTGPDGKPRQLHMAEALRVMTWTEGGSAKSVRHKSVRAGRNTVWDVLECPYFRVERLDLGEDFQGENDGRSFHAFFVTDGEVTLDTRQAGVRMKAGVSCLVPASAKRYGLAPVNGTAQVLRI